MYGRVMCRDDTAKAVVRWEESAAMTCSLTPSIHKNALATTTQTTALAENRIVHTGSYTALRFWASRSAASCRGVPLQLCCTAKHSCSAIKLPASLNPSPAETPEPSSRERAWRSASSASRSAAATRSASTCSSAAPQNMAVAHAPRAATAAVPGAAASSSAAQPCRSARVGYECTVMQQKQGLCGVKEVRARLGLYGTGRDMLVVSQESWEALLGGLVGPAAFVAGSLQPKLLVWREWLKIAQVARRRLQ